MSAYDSSIAPAPGDVASFGDKGGPALSAASLSPSVQKLPTPFPDDTPTELLSRVRIIETMPWSTTTSTIRVIPVLNALLTQLNSFVPLTLYRYLSYKSIGVRLTLNTTSMYKGLLGAHFVPGDLLSSHWRSSVGLSQFQSVYIDASSSEAIEMELPWVFTWPKVDSTYVGWPAGYLCLYPHLPLRSDSNVGTDVSVTVTIEAWLIEPRLHDQVGSGGFVLPVATAYNASIIAFPRIVCQGYRKKAPPNPVVAESSEKAEKGTLTNIAETVSEVSSFLTPVPVIGAIASGVSVVSSALASVFDWFGLSKPPNVTTPQFTLNRAIHYSNTFHGVETAQPMSTNLIPLVASDPLLVAEKEDTCSLYDMARSPSIIGNFNCSTSAVYGTKLFQIPVNPMEFFSGFGTQRFGSHLGYASSFFTAWTGDINYKLVFASTKFQTFRIAIAWTPSAPLAYSQDYRQEKYDVTGTSAIDMIVPWISKYPYRPMRVPNNTDTNLSMSNGWLSVWCLAPIVNNTAAVPSSIDCLVYSAGGSSLRFARYRSPCLTGTTTTSNTYSPTLAQGAFGAQAMGIQTGIIDEDNIVSLRECAKRRCYVGSIDLSNPVSTILYDSASTFNLAYILRKFRYYRGAFVFSYVAEGGTNFTISRGYGSAWELAQERVVSSTSTEGSLILPYLDPDGATETGACFDLDPYYQVITTSRIGSSGIPPLRAFVHATDDLTLGFRLISPILSGTFTY